MNTEIGKLSVRGCLVAGGIFLFWWGWCLGLLLLASATVIGWPLCVLGISLGLVGIPVSCWLAHDCYLMPLWQRQARQAQWDEFSAELDAEMTSARRLRDEGPWSAE